MAENSSPAQNQSSRPAQTSNATSSLRMNPSNGVRFVDRRAARASISRGQQQPLPMSTSQVGLSQQVAAARVEQRQRPPPRSSPPSRSSPPPVNFNINFGANTHVHFHFPGDQQPGGLLANMGRALAPSLANNPPMALPLLSNHRQPPRAVGPGYNLESLSATNLPNVVEQHASGSVAAASTFPRNSNPTDQAVADSGHGSHPREGTNPTNERRQPEGPGAFPDEPSFGQGNDAAIPPGFNESDWGSGSRIRQFAFEPITLPTNPSLPEGLIADTSHSPTLVTFKRRRAGSTRSGPRIVSLPHNKFGPYICPKCNAEFRSGQQYALHARRHHREERDGEAERGRKGLVSREG